MYGKDRRRNVRSSLFLSIVSFMEKIFPIIMIVLSLCSAVIYLFNQDYAKCLYWIFAAGLTSTTLFM